MPFVPYEELIILGQALCQAYSSVKIGEKLITPSSQFLAIYMMLRPMDIPYLLILSFFQRRLSYLLVQSMTSILFTFFTAGDGHHRPIATTYESGRVFGRTATAASSANCLVG
jgi:hypothetical protein